MALDPRHHPRSPMGVALESWKSEKYIPMYKKHIGLLMFSRTLAKLTVSKIQSEDFALAKLPRSVAQSDSDYWCRQWTSAFGKHVVLVFTLESRKCRKYKTKHKKQISVLYFGTYLADFQNCRHTENKCIRRDGWSPRRLCVFGPRVIWRHWPDGIPKVFGPRDFYFR